MTRLTKSPKGTMTWTTDTDCEIRKFNDKNFALWKEMMQDVVIIRHQIEAIRHNNKPATFDDTPLNIDRYRSFVLLGLLWSRLVLWAVPTEKWASTLSSMVSPIVAGLLLCLITSIWHLMISASCIVSFHKAKFFVEELPDFATCTGCRSHCSFLEILST